MKYLIDLVVAIVMALLEAMKKPRTIVWFPRNEQRELDIKSKIDKQRHETSTDNLPDSSDSQGSTGLH